MYDDILNNNLQNEDSIIKAIYDLGIINKERIGDILFLIGTILSFIAADQEEKNILQQPSDQQAPPPTSDALKTATIASWLFFAASIIFAGTAYLRLQEQESGVPENPSLSTRRNLFGRRVATAGNFIKVIGFGMAAVGDQIRVDNPRK